MNKTAGIDGLGGDLLPSRVYRAISRQATIAPRGLVIGSAESLKMGYHTIGLFTLSLLCKKARQLKHSQPLRHDQSTIYPDLVSLFAILSLLNIPSDLTSYLSSDYLLYSNIMVNPITSLATGRFKKMVSAQAKQYEPEDPYYEEYLDSATNTNKRRKRAPPPGLTKQQAKTLKKVARRAHYLDKGFRICGLRFGWTFILGLIPFVGDLTDALLNYNLVVKPARKDAQ